MLIYELLEIKEKDIVSIVGAGGKTTLMFLLANELERFGKVLVTTTTKIYRPNENEVKYLALGKEGYEFIRNNNDDGIYVYGKYINEENKLVAPDMESISYIKNDFKYILIEADGSKKKCLKAWNTYEPVILNDTSKTIGILSLKAIGMKINEENIHRLKEFIDLTNSNIDEEVNLDILIKTIFNDDGLFKNSMGEKILFLNAADLVDEDTMLLLINKIINENKEVRLLSKIIYGSLKDLSLKCIKL
ncbi:selenium cofactor biosynthesis protein YqeC [Clostridium sp. AL.422]|uniref:selenium cofactor biosynthesis protein YqeC n=1 Tax=Clostridium TaxID=1485 RepID=UPI00293DB0D3|nr:MULTISPECIES: selenium cofactor biosynthesis protein YqeC [unclassified Clostridium]MDV4152705.1 selenium cofactor biosynthesis protein YqeC [Clostridium sp. AL.422]